MTVPEDNKVVLLRTNTLHGEKGAGFDNRLSSNSNLYSALRVNSDLLKNTLSDLTTVSFASAMESMTS